MGGKYACIFILLIRIVYKKAFRLYVHRTNPLLNSIVAQWKYFRKICSHKRVWFYWGIGILDISEKGNSLWFIERFLIYRVNMFTVYRQANNINMLKDGMKIEATHVKKKQLHHYLPAEILQKKKKVGLLA